jgi:hypothetical protein
MNRSPWILLITVVLLQGGVFNRIHWMGLINPMVYVMALVWLPLGWNLGLQMLVAFGIGWWVDSSLQSGAIHAMVSTLVIYLRSYWIRLTVSPVTLQDHPDPDLRDLEFRSLLSYAGGLIFIHHAALYLLESLRLAHWGYALLKAFASSILVFGLLWSILQWTNQTKSAR